MRASRSAAQESGFAEDVAPTARLEPCFFHMMATPPEHAQRVWRSDPIGESKIVPLEPSWERALRGFAAQAFKPKALMPSPALAQRDVMDDLEYGREYRSQYKEEWQQPDPPGRPVYFLCRTGSLSSDESDGRTPCGKRTSGRATDIYVTVPMAGGVPLPAELQEKDLERAYAEARYPRCPAPETLTLARQYDRWLNDHPAEANRLDRLGVNPMLTQWTDEEARREWNQFFMYSPHSHASNILLPFDALRRRTWHISGDVINGQPEFSTGPGPLPSSVYGENAWEIDHIRAFGFWDLALMVEVEWAGWKGPLQRTWIPCSCLIPYCQVELATFLLDNAGCPGFAVPNLYAPQKSHLQPHWAANIICWPKGTGSLLVGSHGTCDLTAADPCGQVFVDQRGQRPRYTYRPRTNTCR